MPDTQDPTLASLNGSTPHADPPSVEEPAQQQPTYRRVGEYVLSANPNDAALQLLLIALRSLNDERVDHVFEEYGFLRVVDVNGVPIYPIPPSVKLAKENERLREENARLQALLSPNIV